MMKNIEISKAAYPSLHIQGLHSSAFLLLLFATPNKIVVYLQFSSNIKGGELRKTLLNIRTYNLGGREVLTSKTGENRVINSNGIRSKTVNAGNESKSGM